MGASSGDLVLDMQSMLSDLYWSNSVPDCPILQDTHGDADTIDTYLSMGRAKTRITRLVERYLGVTPVEEFTLAPGQDPFERLGTHMGEVWITGSWTLTPLPTHLIQDAQAFQTA